MTSPSKLDLDKTISDDESQSPEDSPVQRRQGAGKRRRVASDSEESEETGMAAPADDEVVPDLQQESVMTAEEAAMADLAKDITHTVYASLTSGLDNASKAALALAYAPLVASFTSQLQSSSAVSGERKAAVALAAERVKQAAAMVEKALAPPSASMPTAVAQRLPTGSAAPYGLAVIEEEYAAEDSLEGEPILAEGAAGGTQVYVRRPPMILASSVAAPVPAPVDKGPCGVCGKVVTSADKRCLLVGVYMHQDCYDKCICVVCQGKITDLTNCSKTSTGRHVHNNCDPIKGYCPKCGNVVKTYLHPDRLTNEKGVYWHGGCGTAAENMGICPKCKRWVIKREDWVAKQEGYYHARCAD
jgi:hypothetical protein